MSKIFTIDGGLSLRHFYSDNSKITLIARRRCINNYYDFTYNDYEKCSHVITIERLREIDLT